MTTETLANTIKPIEAVASWLQDHLVAIVGACLVLVIGIAVARVISRWADQRLQHSERIDPTVGDFLSNIVKYGLYALVLATVLAQFGVQTTSILAVLGSMGLAIGLALQGTLSNVASGVMILTQRPFKVGEAIQAGSVTGTVQEIGLFTTEIKQFDGLFVLVPNSELWSHPITNFNRHPVRRFELIVGIGYNDSMQKAREVLLALAAEDSRIMDEPEPVAFVASLDDSSVGIGLRVWCETSDYVNLTWDLTEAVKSKFDEKGITIPYPQREVTTRNA